jgi:hypothetical protein
MASPVISVIHKVFDESSITPVDVVVEEYETGAVVEYRKPMPRIVLSVSRPQIIADGVDASTVTASFESCSLVGDELVWSKVVPTGAVTFVVNLRSSVATITNGQATLSLAKTVAGSYRIQASFAGFNDAFTSVEALA